jgi:hypothetical protein
LLYVWTIGSSFVSPVIGAAGYRKVITQRVDTSTGIDFRKEKGHQSLFNADETLSEVEGGVWKAFKAVTTNFIRNLKAKNYMSLVEVRLSAYKIM